MEYVFGTQGPIEVLRTKGGSHTALTGYHSVRIEYPDQTVTDNFRVVRKLRSAEDVEGNCYDWYEIDHHYRITDKTGPIVEAAALQREEMENVICELDESTDERMSAIEDAICEIDEIINGGNEE